MAKLYLIFYYKLGGSPNLLNKALRKHREMADFDPSGSQNPGTDFARLTTSGRPPYDNFAGERNVGGPCKSVT